MPYSWLLFDADGTLYDFERAEAEALEATFVELELAAHDDALPTYHAINKQLWAEFERGEIQTDVLRVERFARLFDALGMTGDAPGASTRYIAHLSRGTHLIEGAEALIDHLAPRYRLAIITNGLSAVQRSRFAGSAIGHRFDPVIISDELGVAKPDPRIFDAAFEAMGWPAKDEVLLIGDSLSSDMKGGVGYGVDTCWYNPRRTPAPPSLAITHELDELAALLSLLG